MHSLRSFVHPVSLSPSTPSPSSMPTLFPHPTPPQPPIPSSIPPPFPNPPSLPPHPPTTFLLALPPENKQGVERTKPKDMLLWCSPVQNIQSKVDAPRLLRAWSLAERRQQLAEDEALHQHNQFAKEQGTPQRFFWRSLYLPEQGMFCQAPKDLQLGTYQKVCVVPAVNNAAQSVGAMLDIAALLSSALGVGQYPHCCQ